MTVWYKTNPRQYSLGLIWARSPSVLAFLLLVLLLKILRIKPRTVVGVSPDTESQTVMLEQLPAAAQQAFRPMLAECDKHAFRLAFCRTVACLGDAEGFATSLLSADGRIQCGLLRVREVKLIECGCAFTSRLQNGSIYTTTNLRRSSELPPGMHTFCYPRASIDEILSRHKKLLEPFAPATIVALTAEQLADEVSNVRRRVHTLAIERGVLEPMMAAEIERLTFAIPEIVPEPDHNPFRSPLADEAQSPQRPRSLWRFVFNGACYGIFLGVLAARLFEFWLEVPANPTRQQIRLIAVTQVGCRLLLGMAGAFFGWLMGRRAQRQTAAATTST